mmetsp:Transcript_12984/g.22956  ORF Transcript_12984/g.22956 Transcript_12984/m.22956 type:complete len:232 (-) Transcript_12984:435-1130(-)
MVALCIHLPLHHNGLFLLPSHHLKLLHAFQSIHRKLLVRGVNQSHDAKGATANDSFALEIVEREVQILQVHPPFKLRSEVPDDVEEFLRIQDQANHFVQGLTCGRPLLLQQEPALSKVVPPAKCSQHLLAFPNNDVAALYQKEMPSKVAFLDDHFSRRKDSLFKLTDGAVDLILPQVLEKEDVRQDPFDLGMPHDLHQGLPERIHDRCVGDAVHSHLANCDTKAGHGDAFQ